VGKHASVACRDCHKTAFQQSGAVTLLKVKDHRPELARSRDGVRFLSRGSAPRLARRSCTSCHSQDRWKPAPGFDHQKTA
jgi:hypothetical protein